MDQVAQIREKIDIVSLISEYLPLKQMGRNFKRTCPFHNEKTPSFVVSPERQIWHCFGCGKGGDCFGFLMEYENLEFVEALRILAKRGGVELVTSSYETGISSQKELLYRINRLACEFYHYLLIKHAVGKKALAYLADSRRIKPQVINTFLLGFSPRGGNVLSEYLLKKKGFSKKDLLEAGVSIERRGIVMDFFADRLMFPLFDHRDNVIGFSGRILSDLANWPKYINTKETLVYHKGSVVFGLNVTKQEIKKENRVIVMEGEFDVLSSFQEGIGNVVAVKGTAFTETQVNLLSRFAQKISLCFDADSAGQEAIKRSTPLFEKKGISATVVLLQGKDPDEVIQKDPVSFKQAVKHDMPVYDFLLSKALQTHDKNSAFGKKQISEAVLPFFSRIENEIVKEHYLKKLSKELDISYESIVKQGEKLRQKNQQEVEGSLQEKKQRRELLEEYLLALLFQYEYMHDVISKIQDMFGNFAFSLPTYQKLFFHLLEYSQKQKTFSAKTFVAALPSEIQSAFDRCFLYPLPKNLGGDFEEEIEKVAQELVSMHIHGLIKKIGEEMKDKELKGKESDVEILQQELSGLVSLLPKSHS